MQLPRHKPVLRHKRHTVSGRKYHNVEHNFRCGFESGPGGGHSFAFSIVLAATIASRDHFNSLAISLITDIVNMLEYVPDTAVPGQCVRANKGIVDICSAASPLSSNILFVVSSERLKNLSVALPGQSTSFSVASPERPKNITQNVSKRGGNLLSAADLQKRSKDSTSGTVMPSSNFPISDSLILQIVGGKFPLYALFEMLVTNIILRKG